MTARTPRSNGFAARPGDAERWIKAPDAPPAGADSAAAAFTARLTIDVTPAMRQRLKLAAITHGTTLADMIRALLAREFPDPSGNAS